MHSVTVESSTKSFPNALKWAYTANWGEKALGALFTFIFAAILGPRDFGVVAIAMAYILFFQMFLDQGFMAAIIQRRNLEREHLDTVFWVTFGLSLALIPLSMVFSGWWAAKNQSPDAANIIDVLSFCIPIEGLAAVQSALLRRRLDFRALSIRTNVASLVGGLVGTGMAVAGYGVWALVGQQLSKDVTALILLWRLSDWHPTFTFSWKHLRDLTSFSISNFVAQLGVFAEGQTGPVILGLFFGPVAVGLYRIAERLTSSVVTMATTSIQSVSFPEFSRLQGKPHELKQSILQCIKLSSTVTLPALALMAASSYYVVAVLGPKWILAANALQILALVGVCSVLAYFTGPLLQALSKTRALAALVWTRMALSALFLLGTGLLARHEGVGRQITAIATAQLILVAGVVTPVYLGILMRLGRVSLGDVWSAVMPSALGATSIVAVVEGLRLWGWLSRQAPAAVLATNIVLGGLTGLSVLLAIDTPLRDMLRSLLRNHFGQDTGLSLASQLDALPDSEIPQFNANPVRITGAQATPLVSIVIPTYNRAYALPYALASALRQTYTNFEVIVVDDGSIDDTLEALEQFRDPRVQLIRHDQNKGCSAAYNTGISAATGKYIAFLDSDDLWKPGYLERHVGFLNNHPEVGVSFCDTEISINGKTTSTLLSLLWVFPRLIRRNPDQSEYVFSLREMHLCLLEEVPVKPSAAVLRLDVLKELGGFFAEAWPSGTDWDLFLRLSWITRFGYIDDPLAIQQRTVDSTHQKFLEKDKQFLLTFLRKERASIKEDREARSAVNRGIASAYNSLAWWYLRAGQRSKALRMYAKGVADTRQPFLAWKLLVALMRSTPGTQQELLTAPLEDPRIDKHPAVMAGKRLDLRRKVQTGPGADSESTDVPAQAQEFVVAKRRVGDRNEKS